MYYVVDVHHHLYCFKTYKLLDVKADDFISSDLKWIEKSKGQGGQCNGDMISTPAALNLPAYFMPLHALLKGSYINRVED